MAFWGANIDKGTKDPKRKFRFKVNFNGVDPDDGIVWYAKSVDKPKLNISADTTHKFLGHTFKFPGSVTWEDIEITLVDPVSPNAAKKLLDMVYASGYKFPKDSKILETISKGKAKTALGPVVISQIDADNKVVEEWILHNPFIKQVAFDQLNYDEDGLSEITLGIVYDWAEFTPAAGTDAGTETKVFDLGYTVGGPGNQAE